MEEEAGAAQSDLSAARAELAAATKDNVDMVAKLRYLERYSAKRAAGGGGNGGGPGGGGVVIRVDGAGVIQVGRESFVLRNPVEASTDLFGDR